MQQLVSIPNFSEGQDVTVIQKIAESIRSVNNVTLHRIDTGFDTHRTVMTFSGNAENVVEAAFSAVREAATWIDMSKHKGIHPRIGATDVLPLVPLSGISMEETIVLARQLAERIADELSIPTYCYEFAAFTDTRRNLAVCRSGEYEGITRKFMQPDGKPDFGMALWNDTVKKSGVTIVGARNFLIAVNFNLNTTSQVIAHEIAKDVRESGRMVNGIRQKGSLKGCKAIGWYVKEYGIAQVSMNITDIATTPLHIAFEAVKNAAQQRGVEVTGTEIIGMIPKSVLTAAGKYFNDTETNETDLQNIAANGLNLNELEKFDLSQRLL